MNYNTSRLFFTTIFFQIILAVDSQAQFDKHPVAQTIPIPALDIVIDVTRDTTEWQLQWSTTEVEPGLIHLDLHFSNSTPIAPTEVLFKWKIPSNGIAGIWHPVAWWKKSIRPDWAGDLLQSRAARNAPVINYFNHDDGNILTIACSDAVNTVSMHGSIREEDANLYSRLRLFTEAMPAMTDYRTQIWLDSRDISFDQAVQAVAQWWTTFDDLQPAPVPDLARLPMYSTWYSYHQTLKTDDLLTECKKGYDLGYRAIIIDDGWQTLDANRGYAYCGDWQPERIPDLKGFVQKVHNTGMKFLLWYSVPFIGLKSKSYERFKDKFLFERKGLDAFVLDPRYPEVRQYLVETYKKAMIDWNLDGFKLDFIDDFAAQKDTELTKAGGRDYASVNEAVDRLMTDILRELRAIKPDVLVEFRQGYIGPAMRKYGNMFRAGDCPIDAVTNRQRTVDLRLTSGTTAVHSDMLMWGPEEPPEVAALQLLNILFSVPQLSVRLAEIPTKHLQMIRFYTQYWVDNREVLLDGHFEARQPLANYPVVMSTLNNHRIVGLYADHWLDLDPTLTRMDVVNGKTSDKVVVGVNQQGVYKIVVYDCLGEVISEEEVGLMPGMHAFEVPGAGLVSFQRKG